jgi:hypothetical protein
VKLLPGLFLTANSDKSLTLDRVQVISVCAQEGNSPDLSIKAFKCGQVQTRACFLDVLLEILLQWFVMAATNLACSASQHDSLTYISLENTRKYNECYSHMPKL